MKKIKITLAFLLVFLSFNTFKVDVSAANNISIYLDDIKQSYSNQAKIQNGTTLVPLRGIFQALGAEVEWNPTTRTIDASILYSFFHSFSCLPCGKLGIRRNG